MPINYRVGAVTPFYENKSCKCQHARQAICIGALDNYYSRFGFVQVVVGPFRFFFHLDKLLYLICIFACHRGN